MKSFLRRKASKISGDEKSNKNNAKPVNLASIDDESASVNSSEGTSPAEMEGSLSPVNGRRPSITDTLNSASTTDSSKKKKDGYMARVAAQSQSNQAYSPWMAMSGMSHAAANPASAAKLKPKPRPKPDGSTKSATASVESVPISVVSARSGEARSNTPTSLVSPHFPPVTVSQSNTHTPNFPSKSPPPMNYPQAHLTPVMQVSTSLQQTFPSRNAMTSPHAHLGAHFVPPAPPLSPPPTGPLPAPPQMPTKPPPPPPAPLLISPMSPLPNPFRSEMAGNSPDVPEADSYATRPPPPPPVAAGKLQRTPSRNQGPPPSAFSKHKRSLSGSRGSPSPQPTYQGLPKPDLPFLPIPPPPPPAPAFSQQSRNPSVTSPTSTNGDSRSNSLASFPEPPSATSQQSQSTAYSNFVPDGYYGSSSASFVAELDGFPQPPTGNPALRPENTATPSNKAQEHVAIQNDRLQAEEDLRETNKVLIPSGILLHASTPASDTSSILRNNSALSDATPTPSMTDGILLSHEEHAKLMTELSTLRTRLGDLEATHATSLDRITEWETYKASMDTYIQQLSVDRQGLIDKMHNSAQAHAAMIQEREKQFAAMVQDKDGRFQAATNHMKTTVLSWQSHSQRLENEKNEALTKYDADMARIKAEHSREIERMMARNAQEAENLKVAHEEQLQNLQSEYTYDKENLTSAFDSARTEHETQKTELMSQISTLDAKNRELMPKMMDLDSQRRNLQGEVVDAKADATEAKEKLEREIALRKDAQRDLKESATKISNLNVELSKQKAIAEDATPKADQLKAEIQEKVAQIERMKEAQLSLEKFLETANQEKGQLKETLSASQAQRDKMAAELARTKAEVTEGKNKINSLENEVELLKRRMYLIGQRMADKVEWYESKVTV